MPFFLWGGVSLYNKVVDTGLDETSCFFVDSEEGDHVTHGYYYDELGVNFLGTSFSGSYDEGALQQPSAASAASAASYYSYYSDYQSEGIFSGGDFSVYPDRRKVSYILRSSSKPRGCVFIGPWLPTVSTSLVKGTKGNV